MQRRAAFAALALAALTLANGQTKHEANKSNLELRLEPDEIRDGIPHRFTFEIVNTTDHDVLLPMPTVQCSGDFDGRLTLNLQFRALEPGSASGLGGGCAVDGFESLAAILERVKTWKTLHSGESLIFKADRAHLFYDDELAGQYEFWANYEPPHIQELDQQLLQQAGMDFPKATLASRHLTFHKRQH